MASTPTLVCPYCHAPIAEGARVVAVARYYRYTELVHEWCYNPADPFFDGLLESPMIGEMLGVDDREEEVAQGLTRRRTR